MNQAQKRYLALALLQLLIVVAVGCFVIYLDPTINKIIPAVVGFGAAYLLTIGPLKLIDWRRAKIAAKQRDGSL